MKVLGNLDLGQNELQNVVIDPTDEFPAVPKPGQFVFKGGRVLACVNVADNIPVWVPMTQEITAYIHTQETLSSSWTINHGFNNRNVLVQVSNASGEIVIPDSMNLASPNSTEVSFATPTTGTAVVMLGTFDGAAKPNVAYTMEFTNLSTVVVNHSLGYNPTIRVYINNMEVQPQSIVHDDVNQATITFSSLQTGEVRCI